MKLEYLCTIVSFDADHGHVWVRQGSADQLGMAPGPEPMTFETWNGLLNRLGGAGWELATISPFGDEDDGNQTWLFKRIG